MEGVINLKCTKCNSSQTRYRVKSKDHFCYTCGNSWIIEEKGSED